MSESEPGLVLFDRVDREVLDSVTLPRIRSSQATRSAESVRARQTCLAGAPIVVDNATVINEVFAPHGKECGLEAIGASASVFVGLSSAKAPG